MCPPGHATARSRRLVPWKRPGSTGILTARSDTASDSVVRPGQLTPRLVMPGVGHTCQLHTRVHVHLGGRDRSWASLTALRPVAFAPRGAWDEQGHSDRRADAARRANAANIHRRVHAVARQRDIESILRDLATPQQGMVGRTQLRSRGLREHVIDRLVQSGRLVVVHRGVYQVGPIPVHRARERAAAMACGRESCISHRSAAVLHHAEVAVGQSVEVIMPRRSRRRIEGVRIHRVRDLPSNEVTTVDGIPVTTPARTLLDLAGVCRLRELEQALAHALRMKLVTRDEVRALTDRHPRHRGVGALRSLLAAESAPAFTRSKAEDRFLALVRRSRLPSPELNERVLGHEVDALWRAERVIAEIDGFAFHNSTRSFTLDRRRDADLTAAGYRVLRFTWADVTQASHATIARLAAALAR